MLEVGNNTHAGSQEEREQREKRRGWDSDFGESGNVRVWNEEQGEGEGDEAACGPRETGRVDGIGPLG